MGPPGWGCCWTWKRAANKFIRTSNVMKLFKYRICGDCRASWTRSGWRSRSWRRPSRPRGRSARSHARPNVPSRWCQVSLELHLRLQDVSTCTDVSVSWLVLCGSGKDCEDIFRRGGRDSQLYLIQPDAFDPSYKVFCDQTTQNGGEGATQPL